MAELSPEQEIRHGVIVYRCRIAFRRRRRGRRWLRSVIRKVGL